MKTNIKKPHLIGKECAKEKIIGLLFTCVYVLFFLGIIHLLYSYHIKKDVLFLFMYPDWMLLSNSLFSIIGISASILLYKKKISDFKLLGNNIEKTSYGFSYIRTTTIVESYKDYFGMVIPNETRTETATYYISVSMDDNNNVSFQIYSDENEYQEATSNW